MVSRLWRRSRALYEAEGRGRGGHGWLRTELYWEEVWREETRVVNRLGRSPQ